MNKQQNESNLKAEVNNLEANDAEKTELVDLTVSDEEEAGVKGGAPNEITVKLTFPVR